MIYPEGVKVLIRVDTPDEITTGGLFVPEMVRQNEKYAATRGRIVAIGPLADIHFCEDGDATGMTKRAAKPGDRVLFVRYAGPEIQRGEKREFHRIINDRDILGFIDESEVTDERPATRKPM